MPSSSTAATTGDRLLEGWTAIVTEAYFNFTELEAGLDAFWFEEYGVKSLWRTSSAQLASFAPLTPLQAVESKKADVTALDAVSSPPLLPAGSPDVAEVAMSPPAAESDRQSVENKSMPPPPSSRRPKRQSAAADATTTPAKKTKTTTSVQAPRHRRPEACVVVDMSHSATHIVPLLFGEVVWAGVKRLDIGGKAMTNMLKETISFKQWDMMEESWIVSHLKEQTMFVAASVHEEDKSKPSCWSPQELLVNQKAIEQEIVLPDYSDRKVARDLQARYGHITAGPSGGSGDDFVADLSRAKSTNATRRGDDDASDEEDDEGEDYRESGSESETDRVVKAPSKQQHATKAKPRQTDDAEEQQVLLLSHERWQIPELLFQPHQIGLEALPLPSLIVAAVQAAFPSPEDEAVRALMFANVMLMGGLANLPGMQRRIELDVRALIDQDFLCRVQVIPNPTTAPNQGALQVPQKVLTGKLLSRAEWEAGGTAAARAKFLSWRSQSNSSGGSNGGGQAL
ncbi:unnamed protein product [Jaminaea pallidilutea]